VGPAVVPALVTGLIQLAPAAAKGQLAYRRAAVLEGEIWRLFTAHLVHLGWAHWAMNALAWAVLWLVFAERLARPCLVAVGLLAALAVGLGLLWGTPQVDGYVGLSGMLHGVFAAAGLWTLRERPWPAVALLLGLAAKLGWEQFHGASAASQALVGAAVIVDAHVYGALGGAVAAALCMAARPLTAPSG
jgi:rhomboid family GlyGly-CTERM serine protease